MAVRKHWTTRIPILGWRIPRSRVLKPGYKLNVRLEGDMTDLDFGREFRANPARLRVVSTEEIRFTPRRDFTGEMPYWTPEFKEAMRMRGEQITELMTGKPMSGLYPGYVSTNPEEKATLRIRTEIGIVRNPKTVRLSYEPTLLSRARR